MPFRGTHNGHVDRQLSGRSEAACQKRPADAWSVQIPSCLLIHPVGPKAAGRVSRANHNGRGIDAPVHPFANSLVTPHCCICNVGGNPPSWCKPPAQGTFVCGAGGNRTPVHQAPNARATTIPVSQADAAWPPGRLTSRGPRLVFPSGHRTFPMSAVFPAAILRFCCRAAVDRPRAAFLLTMSLRSPKDQAARANCSLAILVVAPFNESEQLGSHDRPAMLMSKPVSPVVGVLRQPTATLTCVCVANSAAA